MFFGGHFNLRKFLWGFFILQKQWHANFLLLCISFLLCMDLQPYSHDRFSKILRTFYANRKSWIIVVFLLRTLNGKLPIFLINTLLLHIPLLALTDRWNYRGTNTLAARGLEELFFQLCCFVSFWFWREIDFGFTYLRTLLNNLF
jgi:hypothetical protein